MLIEVKDLWFRYDTQGIDVLQGVSFKVKRGEFVAIIGPNGSGKSTLAKLLNGLYLPTKGNVLVSGIDTTQRTSIWELRQKIGVVFQNPENQIVATVVEEDVAFAPENLGLSRAEIIRRVDFALNSVGLQEKRYSPTASLSGGQKQKVAIAGIIAMLPDCIVLDEPTSMLDPKGKREVIDTILKLRKEVGITVIYITHSWEEAFLSERILMLYNGRLTDEGTPRELIMRLVKKEDFKYIPPVVKLAIALENAGVKISKLPLSPEELVEELCYR